MVATPNGSRDTRAIETMTYRIALPVGGRATELDIADPYTTAVQRLLRRHGLAGYEPTTMACLLALFDARDPGFCFIDVGSHVGLYALVASAMFSPGHVLAIEPAPPAAAVARELSRRNGVDVDVIEAAASDRDGSALLHLADASEVSNSLVEGFKQSSEAITVRTIRVDSIVAATEHVPSVLKIDVEGHEPEVLAGATATIEQHRPAIVVEALPRRRRDVGRAITEALRATGYHFYELSDDPNWSPRAAVVAEAGHRDWLLAPSPVDDAFAESFRVWRRRVEACTADRNSRVPVVATTWAAFRRGGVSEVVAATRRYLRSTRP